MNNNVIAYISSRFRLSIVLSFFLLLLYSCNKTEHPLLRQHYTELIFEQAKRMEKGGAVAAATRLVDSVYATFPYRSVADRYRYYLFRAQVFGIDDAGNETVVYRLEYIDSMLWIIEQKDQQTSMSYEYSLAFKLKGKFFLEQNYYAEAYKYFSKGRLISRLNGDMCSSGEYSGILGAIFFRQGKFEEAVDNYKEAIMATAYCNDSGSQFYQARQFYQLQTNLDNLALSYTRLGAVDSALKYYRIVIAYLNENKKLSPQDLKFREISFGVAYGNLAQAYQLRGDRDSAFKYFRESIRINERDGYDNKDAAVTKLHLAGLYMDTGNYDAAKGLLNEVEQVLPLNDPETKLSWFKMKWQYTRKKQSDREPSVALGYYRFKDSLNEINKVLISTDLIQAFANEEKQHEINNITRESHIRYLYLVSAVIAGCLLAVIVLLTLLNLRRTRRIMKKMRLLNEALYDREQQLKQLLVEQEKRELQKRKEDLFMQEMRLQTEHRTSIIAQRKKISDDIHDDLSGSLAALKFYISDCTLHADSEQARRLLTSIEAEVGTVYENARAYLHNLRTEASGRQYDLIKFLTDMSLRFSQNTSLKIDIDLDEQEMRAALSPQQHELVYFIIKEAISNTIRHSGATAMKVSLGCTDSICHFSIMDNGKGFDWKTITPGIGLQSIVNRVEELGGTLQFVSNPEQGTSFDCSFPLSSGLNDCPPD